MSIDHTLEVRWFFDGTPSPGVQDWMSGLGAEPESTRTDLYLISDDPSMNVKFREGKMQTKRRIGPRVPHGFSDTATGLRERWIKWSFPLDDDAPDLIDHDPTGLWVPVHKERMQVELGPDEQVELLEAAGLEVAEPEPAAALAELTEVTSGDHVAWTVNVESEGEPDKLLPTLEQIAPLFFNGDAPTLFEEGHSFGYARWLQGLR